MTFGSEGGTPRTLRYLIASRAAGILALTAIAAACAAPGDSGSAFLDGSGRALGVLSTLGIALPVGGTNGVGDLARELDYMHTHGGPGATLVLGTEPFNGTQLPIGI